MVKSETRHPIDGPYGCEFPEICNHCRVMTAWSRKTWKFCEQFLHFFGRTTPYGKILFQKFTWRDRLTLLCSNVAKYVRRKSVKSCVIRVNKKKPISAAFQTVANVHITPKICQGQPPTFGSHCSRFHRNRFTFSGVIAKCVKTVLLPHRVFAW